MKEIRRRLFLLFLFIVLIFNLERLDVQNASIINFAPYFYLLVILNLLLPLISSPFRKASVYILLGLWGAIYLACWLYFSRSPSLIGNVQVTVIEFLLLEATVWLMYSLVEAMEKADTTLNTLLLDVFAGRTMNMEEADIWIKREMNRARRHNRPLSVLVLELQNVELEANSAFVKQFEREMIKQFAIARVAQVIGDYIRRTDMVIKGENHRFIVLMPDTDKEGAHISTKRILDEVYAQFNTHMRFGLASFPQDALTFEELVNKATSQPSFTSSEEKVLDEKWA